MNIIIIWQRDRVIGGGGRLSRRHLIADYSIWVHAQLVCIILWYHCTVYTHAPTYIGTILYMNIRIYSVLDGLNGGRIIVATCWMSVVICISVCVCVVCRRKGIGFFFAVVSSGRPKITPRGTKKAREKKPATYGLAAANPYHFHICIQVRRVVNPFHTDPTFDTFLFKIICNINMNTRGIYHWNYNIYYILLINYTYILILYVKQ